MHNIRLKGLLISVSVIIISLLVFFYFRLNGFFEESILESHDTHTRKVYEYKDSLEVRGIPVFTGDLESLFPKQLLPVRIAPKLVPKLLPAVVPPPLQFVGIIETEKKRIYSFRNMDTNRVMLLEEGVSTSGLILLSVEKSAMGTVYILTKDNFKFQVGKK